MTIQNNYSTDKIVEGLSKQNPKILTFIYKTYFPQVRHLVIFNNGSESDAKDIFQTALIAVYKSILKGDLQLKVKFNTYLLSVANNMWLKQLERKKIIEFQSIDTMEIYQLEKFIISDEKTEKDAEYLQDFQLYQRVFSTIGMDCQILLRMFYDKISMKKIAEYFGLKNMEQAKKKKHRCKEELFEKIKKSPEFYNFENE
jgi:RNA polymerase sigma factor (sigma-70 family)